MQNIIEIKNATLFQGGTKVFSRLSLEINSVYNTAILGPNGAGKTTLLKLINREERTELKLIVKNVQIVKFMNSFAQIAVLMYVLKSACT